MHRFFQRGRSMLEVLAVIVLIGILTIGGIVGFKYGILMWKASRTVYQVRQRAVMTTAHLMKHTDFTFSEFPMLSQDGYPLLPGNRNEWDAGVVFEAPRPEIQKRSPHVFTVEVQNVPRNVCIKMLDLSHQYYILDVENLVTGKTITKGDSDYDICSIDPNEPALDQVVHVEPLLYYFSAEGKGFAQPCEDCTDEPTCPEKGGVECGAHCCGIEENVNRPKCVVADNVYQCVECTADSHCGPGRGCCNGVCYDASGIGEQECCGSALSGSLYNPTTQICCHMQVYDAGTWGCCGTEPYRLTDNTKGCCVEASGPHIYSKATKGCCGPNDEGQTLYDLNNESLQCCGTPERLHNIEIACSGENVWNRAACQCQGCAHLCGPCETCQAGECKSILTGSQICCDGHATTAGQCCGHNGTSNSGSVIGENQFCCGGSIYALAAQNCSKTGYAWTGEPHCQCACTLTDDSCSGSKPDFVVDSTGCYCSCENSRHSCPASRPTLNTKTCECECTLTEGSCRVQGKYLDTDHCQCVQCLSDENCGDCETCNTNNHTCQTAVGIGQECCGTGEEATIVDDGLCCNGTVLKENEVCCSNEVVPSELCCNGVILEEGKVCCGKGNDAYAVDANLCCGYTQFKSGTPVSNASQCCAGKVLENGEVCCGGTDATYVADNGSTTLGLCCGYTGPGTGAIITADSVCCGGTVQQGNVCCSNIGYTQGDSYCCYDHDMNGVKTTPHLVNNLTQCCGGEGGLFPSAQEECCGGRLYTAVQRSCPLENYRWYGENNAEDQTCACGCEITSCAGVTDGNGHATPTLVDDDSGCRCVCTETVASCASKGLSFDVERCRCVGCVVDSDCPNLCDKCENNECKGFTCTGACEECVAEGDTHECETVLGGEGYVCCGTDSNAVSVPANQCCGTKVLQPGQECCRETEVYNTTTQSCCGTGANAQVVPKNMCCNGTILDGTTYNECCHETTPYHTSTQACCGSNYEVVSSGLCCGYTGSGTGSPVTQPELCCNGNVYTDSQLACEGQTNYEWVAENVCQCKCSLDNEDCTGGTPDLVSLTGNCYCACDKNKHPCLDPSKPTLNMTTCECGCTLSEAICQTQGKHFRSETCECFGGCVSDSECDPCQTCDMTTNQCKAVSCENCYECDNNHGCSKPVVCSDGCQSCDVSDGLCKDPASKTGCTGADYSWKVAPTCECSCDLTDQMCLNRDVSKPTANTASCTCGCTLSEAICQTQGKHFDSAHCQCVECVSDSQCDNCEVCNLSNHTCQAVSCENCQVCDNNHGCQDPASKTGCTGADYSWKGSPTCECSCDLTDQMCLGRDTTKPDFKNGTCSCWCDPARHTCSDPAAPTLNTSTCQCECTLTEEICQTQGKHLDASYCQCVTCRNNADCGDCEICDLNHTCQSTVGTGETCCETGTNNPRPVLESLCCGNQVRTTTEMSCTGKTNYTWNQTDCECKCNLTCLPATPTLVDTGNGCSCECNYECTFPKVVNGTCSGCICSNSCPPGQVQDPDTCECCETNQVCKESSNHGGFHWTEETVCVAPTQ